MRNHTAQWDAVIVGGGACGLMCAVQAGLLGKRTLILERNDKLGAKILISGGGRCNYTNLYSTKDQFITEDAEFAQIVFEQWTVADTIRFFEQKGIIGQEKTLGQLFPLTNKASDVVDVFVQMMRQSSQEFRLNALVTDVTLEQSGADAEQHLYTVHWEEHGEAKQIRTPKVVFASGGLPVAKMGATDFALRQARKWGIKVVPTAPALVPLVVTGKDADWYASLSGISVRARVSNKRISFEENILFTHWGLSGPAILQISSYWRAGEEILIDLLPGVDLKKLIQAEREAGGRLMVKQLLQGYFSKRLIDALAQFLPLDRKIASLSKTDAKLLVETLHQFRVKPASDKGYDKAEVMRGGVSTADLNPQTLESIRRPGLFFGGEAVDMTGWLGGYNFQWAWASAAAIAKAI